MQEIQNYPRINRFLLMKYKSDVQTQVLAETIGFNKISLCNVAGYIGCWLML